MNKFLTFMSFALLAIVLTMAPDVASATTASTISKTSGGELLSQVLGMVSGSLGTLIGLGIALFGLYMWLIQQSSWGIMVMIGGVALTAFPGIFEWMRGGFESATGNKATDGTVKLK